MGDCQNYGPFLGPYYNTGPNTGPNLGDPKRDHNFDNPPCHVRKFGVGGGPLDLGAYLEGQEDLVTRLRMGIIGVTIWVIRVIDDLLTKYPCTSK